MGSHTPAAPTSAEYLKKIEYQMDGDGNRTAVVVTPYGDSPASTSYTANELNQYTVVGGVNQAHDANGNLTSNGGLTFEYNYRNMIRRVKQGETTVATYKYDALGRRVEKQVTGGTHRFVYSGLEIVSVYDGSNNWVRDFVFGEGIDEPLMMEQADLLDFDEDQDTGELTRHFYHRNALGSVMALTDMNEAVAVSYRYDPYGAVTITRNGTPQSSDPLGNPWTFTARQLDEETGLYHYRARAYDPATGRFLQRDPLGYDPDPNVYNYTLSAPVNRRDPLGLDAWVELGQKDLEVVEEEVTVEYTFYTYREPCMEFTYHVTYRAKYLVGQALVAWRYTTRVGLPGAKAAGAAAAGYGVVRTGPLRAYPRTPA
jgi:RHS repeat-associated protein